MFKLSRSLPAVPSRRLAAASLALVATCGLFSTGGAEASTATTSFAVTATVLSACIVSASPLAFANYDPTASAATTGTTTLVVTCTNGSTYNIGLNPGVGTGATVASRKMTYGSSLLTYGLYQDSGHATVWGQTVGTDTVSGTGTGLPVTQTVYGQIPAQQTAPHGAYTDTITVTVTY
jgi:spore coat protein U-like protein